MKKIIYFIVFVIASVEGIAQDTHFSMFHMMPLYLNPAMTGFFDGDARIGAIYRDQWFTVGSPYGGTKYETFGGYADGDIRIGKRKEDYIGIGGCFIRDVAGDQALTTSDGLVSVAYSKSFGYRTKHSIALGLQGEFIFMQFRNGGAIFPGATSESLGKTNIGIDATVGLRYNVEFQKRVSMYLGFAYAHVSQPNLSFTGVGDDKLYSKIVAHGGALIAVNNKFNLIPNVMFLSQGPSFEANVGASGQLLFGEGYKSTNSFSFGFNARFARPEGGDALIPNVKLDYHNIILGVAYDINVSNLRRVSNTVGAIEISAAYIIKKKKYVPKTNASCAQW
jgi:type IX secretion system PorP/SprF family membrane protein